MPANIQSVFTDQKSFLPCFRHPNTTYLLIKLQMDHKNRIAAFYKQETEN